MTDNEIINALGCCYDLESPSICHQCPLHLTEECRDGYLGLQAYRIINRQKAEIERLLKENNSFADIGKLYSEIKAEAIKEFAERLKEQAKANEWNGTICGLDIERLVKEMVGDNNG